MVLHPDVQRRVQAELDSVLAGERLPTFDDRDSLPYFWNVMREVLRWIVVCKLSFISHTHDRRNTDCVGQSLSVSSLN